MWQRDGGGMWRMAGRPDKGMGQRDPDVDGGGVLMAQTQSSTEPTAHNEDGRNLDVEGMATNRNEGPGSNGAEQQSLVLVTLR